MSTPYSLEDTMRRHDEAMHRWLGGILIDYGTVAGVDRNNYPILRVNASPERAFAAAVNLLVHTGWIAGNTAEEMRANASGNFAVLPLPICSWERDDPIPHQEGWGVPKQFRRQLFQQATQEWETHDWPGTYQCYYRISFWGKKRYTAEYIREWIYSQIGGIGTAGHEVWITVDHADPWGPLSQALRFNDSANLSDLEGEQPRFMRTEYTFTLNLLHFRPPSALEPFEDTIEVGGEFTNGYDDVNESAEGAAGTNLAPTYQSSNLYTPYYAIPLIAANWPVGGNATVQHSSLTPTGLVDPGALLIGVTDPTDQVDVVNRPIGLDADGRAVLSVAFQYRSDVAVDLDVQENDGSHTPGTTPSWEQARLFNLPARASWTRVHFFTVLTNPIFDITVIGTGPAAVARLARIDVRHVRTLTKIAADTVTVGSPDTTYDWTSLDSEPYLVVCELLPVAASGTVTVENDVAASTFSRSEAIDDSVNKGFAILMEPLTTSMRLTLPSSLSVAEVYAQRYHPSYAGHDLP